MLVVQPDLRISIPMILAHPWLKITDSLEGDLSDEADDDHDFQVSMMFGRTECNLNPLFGAVGGRVNCDSQSSLSL